MRLRAQPEACNGESSHEADEQNKRGKPRAWLRRQHQSPFQSRKTRGLAVGEALAVAYAVSRIPGVGDVFFPSPAVPTCPLRRAREASSSVPPTLPLPAGRPLFKERADPLLSSILKGVARHDLFRVRVGSVVIATYLPIEGSLPDAHYEAACLADPAA